MERRRFLQYVSGAAVGAGALSCGSANAVADESAAAGSAAGLSSSAGPVEGAIQSSSALEIRIAWNLISLAKSGTLLEQVPAQRHNLAEWTGFRFPAVRIRDDGALPDDAYEFFVHGESVGRGTVFPCKLLALGDESALKKLEGTDYVGPLGRESVWIEPEQREQAKSLNATVVTPEWVLVSHFLQHVQWHAHKLLTYQHVVDALELYGESNPAIVSEFFGNASVRIRLHRMMCRLLQQHRKISPIGRIIEAVATNIESSSDAEELFHQACRWLADDYTETDSVPVSPNAVFLVSN